jgi:mono/diheme cytochrome c family protein
MLKRIAAAVTVLLLLSSNMTADEDFISHYEYGEMLYKYPRGVSCVECHGEDGSGKLIAEFRDIHGKEQIIGADIRQTSLKKMIEALNSYHKIMPRYYLTDDEVKAIYDFLQEKTKRLKAKKK